MKKLLTALMVLGIMGLAAPAQAASIEGPYPSGSVVEMTQDFTDPNDSWFVTLQVTATLGSGDSLVVRPCNNNNPPLVLSTTGGTYTAKLSHSDCSVSVMDDEGRYITDYNINPVLPGQPVPDGTEVIGKTEGFDLYGLCPLYIFNVGDQETMMRPSIYSDAPVIDTTLLHDDYWAPGAQRVCAYGQDQQVLTGAGDDAVWTTTQSADTTIDLGLGNDVVYNHSSGTIVSGGGGDDTVVSRGAYFLKFEGGKGMDSIDYRLGNARGIRADLAEASVTICYSYSYPGGPIKVDCGSSASVDRVRGVERVWGTKYRDVLEGSSRGESLSGYAGTDLISGRGGGDSLRGGPDDDKLDGGRGTDDCRGGQGEDKLVACE